MQKSREYIEVVSKPTTSLNQNLEFLYWSTIVNSREHVAVSHVALLIDCIH